MRVTIALVSALAACSGPHPTASAVASRPDSSLLGDRDSVIAVIRFEELLRSSALPAHRAISDRFSEEVFDPAFRRGAQLLQRADDRELLQVMLRHQATTTSANEEPLYILGDLLIARPELIEAAFAELPSQERPGVHRVLSEAFRYATSGRPRTPVIEEVQRRLERLEPKKEP